ncbi:MAG: nucleotidyltransferase family protein [Alteraurantiacibacter sp.]
MGRENLLTCTARTGYGRMMRTAVDDFLAQALRGEAPSWPHRWQGSAATDLIVERVQFHGIALLLADMPAALAAWPDDVRAAVMDEARMQVLWEDLHLTMLRHVFDGLRDARVTGIVMKGTALAYSVYDPPAGRRRGDTDLLVRADQLDRVRIVLRQAGLVAAPTIFGVMYQEAWQYETCINTRHTIDLHWRVSDSAVLQLSCPAGEVLAQALPLPGLHAHALASSPKHTFIQTAFNRALHKSQGYLVGDIKVMSGDRLIWASDFDRLQRQFSDDDWAGLCQLALARGIAAIVLDAMRFARAALGAPLPAHIEHGLAAHTEDSGAARYLAEHDHVKRYLADFHALPGLGEKLGMIRRLTFPSSGHLRDRFPDMAGWPIVALYLRWMWRNWRRAFSVSS